MTARKLSPYGTWKSPITTSLMTRGAVGLGPVTVLGGRPVWAEQRPFEAGRTALVMLNEGGMAVDLMPEPYNARSRVHEYGGGAFVVLDESILFVDGRDQRLVRVWPGGRVECLFERPGCAYADFVFDRERGRVICVEEDASGDGEPSNRIVSITLEGERHNLVEGADFYMAPKLSPDGGRMAWVEWYHPDMPWDGTVLMEAAIDDAGVLRKPVRIAGSRDEAIFQPEYAPDGTLHYVSDREGTWNIARTGEGGAVYRSQIEFGLPHWQFGMRTYGFMDDGTIIATGADKGEWGLYILRNSRGFEPERLDLPWCCYDWLTVSGQTARFVGGRKDAPQETVELDLDSLKARVLKKSAVLDVPADTVSKGQPITFPSTEGRVGHAWYYPPMNGAFVAPEGELPPMIVKCHGGPTGQSTDSLSLKTQFWTSRGFAILDVNYAGSTGYGRKYRHLLDCKWGIYDVEDCVNAARHMVDRGLADPARLLISGGSAGGFTVLKALTDFDVFAAGCSSYGVADLVTLAQDTHKFESRYLDRLIGPWPERADLYRERSPVNASDRLSCPVIFLQGADDKVVPPSQTEAMVAAMREKKLPVAYLLFDGEGHGFRRADTVRAALDAELSFYGRIFGFSPPDIEEPVEIENFQL